MKSKHYLVFFAICLLAGWLQPARGQVVIDSIVPVPGCLPSGSFVVFGSGLNNVNSIQFGNVANSATINLTTATAVAGTWSVSPSTATGSTVITVSDPQSTDTLSLPFANPDPGFSFPSSFCSNSGLVGPLSISDTSGLNYFSCNPNGSSMPCDSLSMDSVTGVVDPANSAPGFYEIEHTVVAGNGGCTATASQQITIQPYYNVQIDYPDDEYCENDFPVTPTLVTPDSSGFFYANLIPGTGLPSSKVNFVSIKEGIINFSLSNPGTYVIEYVSPIFCSEATDTVTIIENQNADFDYDFDEYCQNDPNPSPVINGVSGGVFSEISGNVVFVDTISGEIDLLASTPGGPYFIYYTTPGPCPGITFRYLRINPGSDSCSVVGMEEQLMENEIRVFPNPTSGSVNVKFLETRLIATQFKVISSRGKVIMKKEWTGYEKARLDLSALPPGIYLLEIKGANFRASHKLSIIR